MSTSSIQQGLIDMANKINSKGSLLPVKNQYKEQVLEESLRQMANEIVRLEVALEKTKQKGKRECSISLNFKNCVMHKNRKLGCQTCEFFKLK